MRIRCAVIASALLIDVFCPFFLFQIINKLTLLLWSTDLNFESIFYSRMRTSQARSVLNLCIWIICCVLFRSRAFLSWTKVIVAWCCYLGFLFSVLWDISLSLGAADMYEFSQRTNELCCKFPLLTIKNYHMNWSLCCFFSLFWQNTLNMTRHEVLPRNENAWKWQVGCFVFDHKSLNSHNNSSALVTSCVSAMLIVWMIQFIRKRLISVWWLFVAKMSYFIDNVCKLCIFVQNYSFEISISHKMERCVLCQTRNVRLIHFKWNKWLWGLINEDQRDDLLNEWL